MKSLRSESSSLYLGQESLRAILGTLVRLSCDEAQPEANASGWRFTQHHPPPRARAFTRMCGIWLRVSKLCRFCEYVFGDEVM